MEPAVILSTYPDQETADATADGMVRRRLAACANILEIRSVYLWQGKVEKAPELLVIFKTTQARKEDLKEQIRETHPYEVPEIVELGVSSINEPYLRWLAGST